MKVTGKGKHKILFVGEAPGKNEDEQGEQFVGDSGDCLKRIIKPLGLDLDDCWKTNAAICRPPENKIESLHIESCRPNLTNAIEKLKPSVIVLLGGSAVESLLPFEWKESIGSITRWVGWNIPSNMFNAWIIPTYHPSFVMRMDEDPPLVLQVRAHIKKAMQYERIPVPALDYQSLVKQVEVIEDPVEGCRRMKKLWDASGMLAFDFETTGLKPELPEQKIYTVSFCLDGKDTFACPIKGDVSLGVLSKVLLNTKTKKIASNMKFEERWSRAKLGHGVANWHYDTMLGAHVLDNRGDITSVKFQAFVRLGIGDYTSAVPSGVISDYLGAKHANDFNRITEAPLRDILIYNGLDSLLEYKVAEHEIQEFENGR